MAGTREGGKRAAETNKRLHGDGFYARIGAIGGKNGHTGGFAANRELARIAGAKGGRKSRRGKSVNQTNQSWDRNTAVNTAERETANVR